MIGFLTEPTGRLGNILLQYLFLREVSVITGIPYFHGKLKGESFFESFEETENYKNVKQRILHNKSVDNAFINRIGIEAFTEFVKSSKKNIILKPSVLGHTFETMYKNPNDFIKIKEKYKVSYIEYSEKVVAMHYRGTDFATWNPVACLNTQYYINSIEYCLKKFNNQEVTFSLFTDDLELDSYRRSVAFLEDRGIVFHEGDPTRNLGEEFYNISISDIVVSSPSTFAITASLVGKKKTIIHSKKWCDYCQEKNDKVWVQMLNKKCDFYKLEAII